MCAGVTSRMFACSQPRTRSTRISVTLPSRYHKASSFAVPRPTFATPPCLDTPSHFQCLTRLPRRTTVCLQPCYLPLTASTHRSHLRAFTFVTPRPLQVAPVHITSPSPPANMCWCYICGRHFPSEDNLQQVSARQPPERPLHIHTPALDYELCYPSLFLLHALIYLHIPLSLFVQMPVSRISCTDIDKQHQQVHKPRNLECWFCYSTFKSPADMFLHVEMGKCGGSETGASIHENTIKCQGPWKNRSENGGECPFGCPMCDRVFRRISAFLQHVQSSRCGESYTTGRASAVGMLRQLRRNLGLAPQWIEDGIKI